MYDSEQIKIRQERNFNGLSVALQYHPCIRTSYRGGLDVCHAADEQLLLRMPFRDDELAVDFACLENGKLANSSSPLWTLAGCGSAEKRISGPIRVHCTRERTHPAIQCHAGTNRRFAGILNPRRVGCSSLAHHFL